MWFAKRILLLVVSHNVLLVCIQVGLFWISTVAACEDKLMCTCQGLCKKGGPREVRCSRFRLHVILRHK